MQSISQFKKENFISNSDSSIRDAANKLELPHVTKEIISVQYESLKETMVEIGAFCKLETDDAFKPSKLYMLKVYKCGAPLNIVKIGISSNVIKRIDSLNKCWKSTGYSFKLYRVSEYSSYNMSEVEKSIHTLLRFHNRQADLGHNINGYTELFMYSKWMDNLISNIDDYNI